MPQPKLRVSRSYVTRSLGHFIPDDKMYCENYHAPYRKAGAIRGRVVSLLVPAPLQRGQLTLPSPRQMEIF